MQYPTPQFIEEEGKIVFFLTFRQFFILVGGGATCFLLFYILPFFIFVIVAIPIVLLTGIIAFLKINNESVVSALLHFIGFTIGKKNYVWRKKEIVNPINTTRESKLNDIKQRIETKK